MTEGGQLSGPLGWIFKLKYQHWVAILVIASALPMITPLALPMPISYMTTDSINLIKQHAGQTMIRAMHVYEVGGYQANRDYYTAEYQFMAKYNIKIVMVSFGTGAEQIFMDIIKRAHLDTLFGYVYGQDYVLYPYIAGDESAISAVASDFQAALPRDYLGTPTSQIPLTAGISNLKAFAFDIFDPWGWTGTDMFIRQWAAKYGVPTIAVVDYVNVAYTYGTYIQGCISEIRGMTEFEVAVGKPGTHVAMMDARNLQAYALYVGILWGMVATFVASRRKTEEKTEVAT